MEVIVMMMVRGLHWVLADELGRLREHDASHLRRICRSMTTLWTLHDPTKGLKQSANEVVVGLPLRISHATGSDDCALKSNIGCRAKFDMIDILMFWI